MFKTEKLIETKEGTKRQYNLFGLFKLDAISVLRIPFSDSEIDNYEIHGSLLDMTSSDMLMICVSCENE